jgi:hypothetical protein
MTSIRKEGKENPPWKKVYPKPPQIEMSLFINRI